MTVALKLCAVGVFALLLSGCVITQGLQYMREDALSAQRRVLAQRDTAVVAQSVVSRVKLLAPQARIGVPVCSGRRMSWDGIDVCRVSIDGRQFAIEVRYDPDRGRTVADLQGAIVRASVEERGIEALLPIAYGMRGVMRCGGRKVIVMPVGSTMRCALNTADGRRHDVVLAAVRRLTPHVVAKVDGIALLPAIAAARAALYRAYRADPAELSGHTVAAFLDATAVPEQQSLRPSAQFGPAVCPRRIDARATVLEEAVSKGCWLPSRDGAYELAVFTDTAHRPAFQLLSVGVDLRKATAAAMKAYRAYARRHPGTPPEAIDCGPSPRIVLSLLSVHYCQIEFASGRSARLGIEYYDPLEGPHLVYEKPPSST